MAWLDTPTPRHTHTQTQAAAAHSHPVQHNAAFSQMHRGAPHASAMHAHLFEATALIAIANGCVPSATAVSHVTKSQEAAQSAQRQHNALTPSPTLLLSDTCVQPCKRLFANKTQKMPQHTFCITRLTQALAS